MTTVVMSVCKQRKNYKKYLNIESTQNLFILYTLFLPVQGHEDAGVSPASERGKRGSH